MYRIAERPSPPPSFRKSIPCYLHCHAQLCRLSVDEKSVLRSSAMADYVTSGVRTAGVVEPCYKSLLS